MDSWEDMADNSLAPKPTSALNPNAKAFSFNPNASSWTPSFATPSPQPAQPQPYFQQPQTYPPPAYQPPQYSQTPAPVQQAPPAQQPPVRSAPAAVPSAPAQTQAQAAPVGPKILSLSAQSTSTPATKPKEKPAKQPEEKPAKQPEEKPAKQPEETASEPQKLKKATSSEEPAEVKEEVRPRKTKKEIKRDPRPHLNLIFIGHVDAGKSTISGHLLYQTGMVDDRTLEKYEREAKLKNRDSWKFAWTMDISEEERDKGKTHETGTGYFETPARRYTILDAPGHKAFVPSMIGGACQADIGILVISARKGEFETGFEKGGQTREHAILAKTAGVRYLIIVINKMDDQTVEWAETRYKECVDKLAPFLKGIGYHPSTFEFMPLSGFTGANLAQRTEECSWYSGCSLLEALDKAPVPELDENEPVRFPIQGKFRDMGTVVHGMNYSGSFVVGDKLLLLPLKKEVVVEGIMIEGEDVERCFPSDNVHLKLKGADDDDLRVGYVLCEPKRPIHTCTMFTAQLLLLECKNIVTVGYSAVLHLHAVVEECSLAKLLCTLDKKGNVIKKSPPFVKGGETVLCRVEVPQLIALEPFKVFSKLGRFILRDEGRTIAVGVITKVFDE
eukprot:NODE_624_length_2006_cov_216.279404_g580_i0.p1 GENE.NODE_624_length_2006_cov_216.279404_g580_i0~~NODE_624_length_2006_cov_216.279404_g580_i0.p1  ORF type:complete len:616 (-),score=174.24 NODE_624_length_2006_cov_216.279404_g580_i0:107-1954(-)